MLVHMSAIPRGSNLPINGFVVSLRCHYFRRKIIGGSAERPGDVWHLFREPKVGDLEMAVAVEEQIFGFQIAVYNVLAVQVVQCQRDFGRVKFGDRVREALSYVSRGLGFHNSQWICLLT
jgi:hypothetical protein